MNAPTLSPLSGLGYSPSARRYSGNRLFFLFLGVLRCFSSPSSLLPCGKYLPIKAGRLPHSEISGLKVACTYPKLIAACHVLHRHVLPRHPPYAVISLTINSFFNEQKLVAFSHSILLYSSFFLLSIDELNNIFFTFNFYFNSEHNYILYLLFLNM